MHTKFEVLFFYDYNSHVVVFGLDGVLRKNSALIKMPHIPAHPISAEDAEHFLRCELQNYNHILYRKFNIIIILTTVYM